MSAEQPLPRSWTETTLDSLLHRIEAGLNVKCEERPPNLGEKGLVKISAVTWGQFDELQSKTLPASETPVPSNRIQPGDLLISRANTIELVGSSVIVKELQRELYLSDKVLRLVVHEPSKRWINYALKTPALRKAIEDGSSGNQLSMRNISQEKLKALPLPLAPEAEQKRIADKLDTVLTRVDAVNTRLARVAPLLKRFRQSVLAAATSGRLTEDWRISSNLDDSSTSERVAEILFKRKEMWNGRGKYTLPFAAADVSSAAFLDIPKSWIRGTLDQVAWSVKDGPHFSPEYTSQGIPFISGRNIRPGKIDLSNAKFISNELHAELSQRCKPSYGDVLYTKGGTTGIAAVNTLSADFNVWVHVAVLKLLPPAFVDPFFVQHALNSPACYEQSQLYTHGVGNQDLGLTRMIKIILPIPPVQEQTEIVRRVETLFAFADRLEARLAQAQTAATRLTPALLAKAFRGELVPQDPNDEPAADLLRRLQAERATAPKASAGRVRKAVVQG